MIATKPIRVFFRARERTLLQMLAKCFAGLVIDAIPARLRVRFLRRAAVAPPIVKNLTFQRLCARASYNLFASSFLLETNLGVSKRIRCSIPAIKYHYAFGKPTSIISERATLDLAAELSKDCNHFLDVGAHEGIFLFYLGSHRRSGLTLHWFEPDKALAERLARNLEKSSVQALGHAAAIDERSGESLFFRNLTDDLSSSLNEYFKREHSISAETVKTISLNDYVKMNKILNAIIKVDVEGAGLRVWSGIGPSASKISYLIMEMLETEIREQLPLRIITETQWFAYYIKDYVLIQSVRGEFEYVEPFWNWLFCGLDPSTLASRLRHTKFTVRSAA